MSDLLLGLATVLVLLLAAYLGHAFLRPEQY